MSKVILQDIGTGYNLSTVVNNNNDFLEEAFDNTLSRDGSGPNEMRAALDMNSHSILNLGSPTSLASAARWADVVDAIAVENPLPSQTGNEDKVISTDGETLFWADNSPYATRTEAEIEAGATIANARYPEGYVDRYEINEEPGVTDMSGAFNMAVQVASREGCSVRWGATGRYLLGAPINCTNIRGVQFYDDSSCDLSTGITSLKIAHNGHAFDMSASTELGFHDVSVTTEAGFVPQSLFFIARNAAGSGADFHRFYNIKTTPACKFEDVWYTYGSEMNSYIDCVIYNSQPNSSLFNHNYKNPKGRSSTFTTIFSNPSGASNVVFNHQNGMYFNTGSGTSTIYALEGSMNFTTANALHFCPNGLSYMTISGDLACNFMNWRSCRGETDSATTSPYAIYVNTTGTTGVNRHVKWNFTGVHSEVGAGGYFLYFADTAEVEDLNLQSCSASTGLLLSAYNLQNCYVRHGTSAVTGRAGGTITGCFFHGTRANVTLSGTDSANGGFDIASGEVWQGTAATAGDNYTSASTACTGALTTAISYKVSRSGKQVELTLPQITGTTTATTAFTLGVALPTQFRPTSSIRQPCIIQDNGTVLNQLGFVNIDSGTGVITVYKDIVGSGNFTNAVTGGLPGSQSFSWRV
jgi:hypothetical protein